MNRIFNTSLASLCAVILGGCGGEEAETIEDESGEVMMATAFAQVNKSFQDIGKYECRCFWSDGYDSEDQCLNNPGLNLSHDTVRGCLVEFIEELPPYDGDLAPLSQCVQGNADSLESCVDSSAQTCSVENLDNLVSCYFSFWDQTEACWVLSGRDGESADEEWLEQFFDQAYVQCGVIWDG